MGSSAGKMRPFEATSQLDNQQQHPDLRSQSDPSIDNDKLLQVLAQNLENLALSCKDEVIDRRIQGYSVVTDEEDQVKQAVDDDLRHLVAKEDVDETFRAECSSGSEVKNHRDVWRFGDVWRFVEGRHSEEVRVFEERENGESEIGCENHDEEVNNSDDEKDCELKYGDLKEKHEIEIEDGYDWEYERVQDLENESKIVGGDGWEEGSVSVPDDGKSKGYHYPVRLDAEDCLYYIRTGTCKFGSNCKFNHHLIRKNQPTKETKKEKKGNMEKRGQTEGKKSAKETKKQKEENMEKRGQTECKPANVKKKQKEENMEMRGQVECKPVKETKKQKEENMKKHGHIECKLPANETKKPKEEKMDKRGHTECKLPAKETKKQKEENMEKRGKTECKPAGESKKHKEENLEKRGETEYKRARETKKQKEENMEKHGHTECRLPAKEIKKQKEENMEKRRQTECKLPAKEIKKQKEENMEKCGQTKCKPTRETKKQKEENMERRGQTECKPVRETKKQKEENMEKHGQTESQHHTSPGGCKHGKACKCSHGRGKTVKTPVVEYNFLGLPIRPGEKECSYYMRNGSCKHGQSCWFNHPDPTAVGGSDSPSTCGNDGHLPLQPEPEPNISNLPSWSAPRTPDPTAAFVFMMYSPTQNTPQPNPDWNCYQAPVPVPVHLYPSSEHGLHIPPAFFLNNPPSDTNMYTHEQQPVLVSEYPESPRQPDCSYFMKTGVCKYRASCKFHHPQSQTSGTLRDQNICTHFSRHGTCKYGTACKYDHPVNSNPARDGSNGPGPMTQQSV